VVVDKILCPVDFFPGSHSAVSYAIALAGDPRTKIFLLHVIAPISPATYFPYTKELIKSIEEDSAREIKKIAERISNAGVPVETYLRVGDVYDEIRRCINLIKPQLVVVGTHGRRALTRWFMGSTTDKLLRHCPIPILMVNPRIKRTGHGGQVRRILVTTDFSEGTADALAYALSLGRKHGARITLLHVVDDIAADISGDYRDALLHGVQKELDDLVRSGSQNSSSIVTKVATGRPSRIILRMLSTEKIDLIVMNIHGKTMLDRAMIGSTAERVVRSANCPVMLIPPIKKNGKKTASRSTAIARH
jgi:nucleotide-binding universal stress UspA family protein